MLKKIDPHPQIMHQLQPLSIIQLSKQQAEITEKMSKVKDKSIPILGNE